MFLHPNTPVYTIYPLNGTVNAGAKKQYVVNEDGVKTTKLVNWSTDNVLAVIDSEGLITIDPTIASATVVHVIATVDGVELAANLTIN